jgi:uncharacterized SAM-binding protein YcdF (DUF218 family)
LPYIIKFIYHFFLPPGIIVVFLVLIGVMLHKRDKLFARLIFAAALLLYLSLIPLTGNLLIHTLENRYTPPSQISGDVIVILGGGATLDTPDIDGKGQLSGFAANRLLTGVRLYKRTHLPIVFTGGQVFPDAGNEAEIAKRQLISLGVPEDKIFIDDKSINTVENGKFTKVILMENHWHKPVLVTSAFHMARSVRIFKQNNIHVVPYPTDYQVSRKTSIYLNQFTPSSGDLTLIAAKEYLGILSLMF